MNLLGRLLTEYDVWQTQVHEAQRFTVEQGPGLLVAGLLLLVLGRLFLLRIQLGFLGFFLKAMLLVIGASAGYTLYLKAFGGG